MPVAASFVIHPGDPDSSVILHVPHASRVIPPEVRRAIQLTDLELEVELDQATDTHAGLVADRAAVLAGVRPSMFVNQLSRIVVDPERFPDEWEPMSQVGRGAVYLRGFDGKVLRSPDPVRDAKLLEEYFDPYAASLAALVGERLSANGWVCIVDIHSYRAVPHPNDIERGNDRPLICMGTDDFHTPQEIKDAFVSCFAPQGDVLENVPYAGTYVPLEFYGTERRVASVMLELRADALADASLEPTDGVHWVAASLAAFVDRAHRWRPSVMAGGAG